MGYIKANFDPSLVAAKFALCLIHPEELPAFAAEALEAGYDGPTIRRVAALDQPNGWEVDQLLVKFLGEMGVESPPTREYAAARVAYEICSEIIDENKDPIPFLDQFERLWTESGYVSEIVELGTLKEDLWLGRNLSGLTESQIHKQLREVIAEFVSRFKEVNGGLKGAI